MTFLMVSANLLLGLAIGTLVDFNSPWLEWVSVVYVWFAGYMFGEYHYAYRNDFPWTIGNLKSKFKVVGLKKQDATKQDVQLRSPPEQLRQVQTRRIPKAGTDSK